MLYENFSIDRVVTKNFSIENGRLYCKRESCCHVIYLCRIILSKASKVNMFGIGKLLSFILLLEDNVRIRHFFCRENG